MGGDEEPEVLGECMSGLLTVDPDYSLPFIATYLDSTDDILFELAALAADAPFQPTVRILLPISTARSQHERQSLISKVFWIHTSQIRPFICRAHYASSYTKWAGRISNNVRQARMAALL